MSEQAGGEARYCLGSIRIVAIGLALLCACNANAERPVRSLLEYRNENLIRQQWDNSCAAAALATLLTYDIGRPVTERQVATGLLRQTDELKVRTRGGFSLLDMKRYLKDLGIDSDGYAEMSIDDLAEMAPMIVPLHLHGYDHFVLVRRVDGKQVDIGDPAFGNYRMEQALFLRRWSKSGFRVENTLRQNNK